MKKTHSFLFALLTAPLLVSGMASCSDDDKNEPLPGLPNETVYTGKTLHLEYEDALMAGKSVRLSRKGNSYVMDLYSTINPGELMPSLSSLPTLSGPGVLPGSPVVSIPVRLKADKDEYDFEGRSETDYCTFEYSGDIKGDILDLEIDDVVLKNRRLADTAWKPAPLKPTADGLAYSSSPIYINWTSSLPIQIGDIKADPGDILNLIATMPLIPIYNGTAKTSVAELLSESLKSIGFRNDGLVAVNYVSTVGGADRLASLPQNMIQYVVLNDNTLKAYPNPMDVYSMLLTANSSRSVTLDGVLELMKNLLPMVAEGVPFQYDISHGALRVYLNTETLKPIVSGVLIPILTDPDILAQIQAAITADPVLAKYGDAIKMMLSSLPQLIEKTTKMEIGLNLLPFLDKK